MIQRLSSRSLRIALVTSLAVSGCGANVVFVDDGQGQGGQPEGAGGSGGDVSDCAQPFEGERHDMCFSSVGPPCPPSDSGVVVDKAIAEVTLWDCDEDCCFFYVQDIPCGLPSSSESCCYAVDVVRSVGCEGDP